MRWRALSLVVGIALLLAPAGAGARTLELETGRVVGPRALVVKDGPARGGRTVSLAGRGWLRRSFVARSPVRSLVVRFRGLPCGGAPRLSIRVDGRLLVRRRAIRARRYVRLRVGVRLAAGRHSLRLGLANPRRTRSCRRRVLLDALGIGDRAQSRTPDSRSAPPATTPPPAPPPTAPDTPESRPDPPPPTPTPEPPPPPPSASYRNPVFASPGAPDPMVLDVGGAHSEYLAFSTGERFPMLRSTDLRTWTEVGQALPGRPSWAAQSGDWNPWAPSVIERAGPCPGEAGTRCFVLFHVSRHGTLSPTANCIGVAVSPTPSGPYEEIGPLQAADGSLDLSGRPPGCGDDAGYSNIDPAPFVDSDGTPYLYYSTTRRCPDPPTPGAVCDPGRTISVIELSPGLLTAAGPRQPLFEGDPSTWELAANFVPPAPVVENPWPVKRGNTYLMLYSGGAYNGPYGGGYASSASPTGPFTKATENPFLREANSVLSVGGATVATGPKGGDWLIYHGREGGYGNPRQLRIDPVRYPSASTIAVDGPTSEAQTAEP